MRSKTTIVALTEKPTRVKNAAITVRLTYHWKIEKKPSVTSTS
jgi:hypothetical protein